MTIDDIRNYCLRKSGTEESQPFDETTIVFKVGSKMYCLLSLEHPISINLKSNPEKAIELREQYDEIVPGYHMNKKHWNTIYLNGSLKSNFVNELIDDSYELVFDGLSKKVQLTINNTAK